MSKEPLKEIELKAAGHGPQKLLGHPGEWQCGDVKDGVAFRFGNEGGWVVEFSDLERLYLAARKQRGLSGQAGEANE